MRANSSATPDISSTHSAAVRTFGFSSSARCSRPRKKISSPMGLKITAGTVKIRYGAGMPSALVSSVPR